MESAPAWICRCYSATILDGEVAERLNAAVSKTVGQDLPGPGVRIPPSPLQKAKSSYDFAPASRTATHSISTRAPFTRPETATVERAGLWPLNLSA